jgi:hypothetical protein
MTKPNKLLLIGSVLMIILGTGIVLYKNNTGIFDADGKQLQVFSMKQKDGWGYRIAVSGRDIIKQDNIPAVSGQKAFANEEDALKTGKLVLKKIQDGKLPNINKRELDSLHVQY